MTNIMLKEARQLAMHVGGYHKEVMDALVNRLEKWESVFGHLGEPDEVGNEWHALSDRLEAAENENAKLRIALAEKVTSETILRDLSVGNGSINATFEGGAVQLMVDALATQFVESGAANYIEMQFHSEATGPLLFTLQRVDGKTPHQLRAEAEQERDWHAERCEDAMNECDTLRARIAEMEEQEPVKHEFQGRDGVWYPFIDQRHHENTLADGSWPVRALYAESGAKGEGK